MRSFTALFLAICALFCVVNADLESAAVAYPECGVSST